jgi:hypothetical protein
MSDEARDLLKQLLAEISGNGHGPTPQVPAPPVAAVLRPSTWSRPPAPGEVIGDGGAPASSSPGSATSLPAATGGRVEHVSLRDDAALDAFVRVVLSRADEIRAGMLRFTLGAPATSSPAGVVRVDRGAVTERIVKQAADAGARLVLAPRAVITPLARERARALGVEIERER